MYVVHQVIFISSKPLLPDFFNGIFGGSSTKSNEIYKFEKEKKTKREEDKADGKM